MNIRNVGLIRRVFPQAKFILALRHPCDCVLSCFMQNFILLEATYNFLTIEGSAKLYAEVMDLWKAYINKLNIDVFTVKYEELILDAKKTGQDLVAFLGLHWDENLLDHQATARRRGQIETPSYNQVVEPIYTRSSGRWRNYHDRIEPVLPVLEPWIREFGYDS